MQLGDLLGIVIRLLQFLFIARFIAQLFDAAGGNPITRTLIEITEPILAPVRRILPSFGGFDFSPMIILFGLDFLRRFVVASL